VRIRIFMLAVIVCVAVLGIGMAAFRTKTLFDVESQSIPDGETGWWLYRNAVWGCRIVSCRTWPFKRRTKLTFYAGTRKDKERYDKLSVILSGRDFTEVSNYRWVGRNSRGLLLNLGLSYYDSGHEYKENAKILYVFSSGQIFIDSPALLWRVGLPGDRRADKDDLELSLCRLEREAAGNTFATNLTFTARP